MILKKVIHNYRYQKDKRYESDDRAHIWIYESDDAKNRIVIIQELPFSEYVGMSITNAMERILTSLYNEGVFDPFITTVFEHYPENAYNTKDHEETFCLVSPVFSAQTSSVINVSWKHSNREEVEIMIGGIKACQEL